MTFFFDHDVPDDLERMLGQSENEVIFLRSVLPRTASDAEIFDYACNHGLIMVTCNRDDFQELATARTHPGLIILFRRHTRQDEAAHFLRLIENAGDSGLRGNINFA